MLALLAQLPLPSHASSIVWVEPEHATKWLHVVPAAYFSHAPVPLTQLPSVPHDDAPMSVHAAAQQMPFGAQMPLVHPSALMQAPPFATLGWHAPALQ